MGDRILLQGRNSFPAIICILLSLFLIQVVYSAETPAAPAKPAAKNYRAKSN